MHAATVQSALISPVISTAAKSPKAFISSLGRTRAFGMSSKFAWEASSNVALASPGSVTASTAKSTALPVSGATNFNMIPAVPLAIEPMLEKSSFISSSALAWKKLKN